MFSCETHLETCPIFRGLGPDEREIVLGLMESRSIEHGHNIITEGNLAPQGLWAIRTGDFEVLHFAYDSGERQVAMLHSGSIFGEISFFDPQPHVATVRALTDGECLYLSLDRFRELEAYHPRVALKFLANMGRILAGKMRRTDRMLANHIAMSPALAEEQLPV